jgi:teichuronic acid biosynthesis glycosyltransferase TuaC
MAEPLRVFMITSEWPTPDKPYYVPFIVRQVNFLRRAGVQVEVFHFRGGKNPINYYRAWKKARCEMERGEYDLIHAQWGQSGILALPKLYPLIVTFRGDDLEGIVGQSGRKNFLGLVLKTMSRLVALTADQVILVSERLARSLPRKDYQIIPSGIDLNLFRLIPQAEARKRLNLDPDRRYILFAGSVTNPRKRYALAKQSVEMLDKNLNVELLIAANIAHEQMPEYMNASDVLLLTSVHEGSPNVVKEALACNLPVVSTDVGDVRQRIASIPGCMLVDDNRPETIAAALQQVLSQDQRSNSRPGILELDEVLLTEKVIGVYRKALIGKQRVPEKQAPG